MSEREVNIKLAMVAEIAERRDDMVKFVKSAIEVGGDFTDEDRNLLSVAYKNAVDARRSAWRVIGPLSATKVELYPDAILNYRQTIEKEISDLCHEVLHLLDEYVIPSDILGEHKVFFNKMKGDYYGYLAEISTGSNRDDFSDKAEEAYQTANIEGRDMAASSVIRLGLALNFSLFYYEIRKEIVKAFNVAKKAFEEANESIDSLEEEGYKDATLLIQTLRDNLVLWESDNDEIESEFE